MSAFNVREKLNKGVQHKNNNECNKKVKLN